MIYTKELRKRKEQMDHQMESSLRVLKSNNDKGMDAQRFGQIAKGLHAATNFERVNAMHRF